MLKLMGREIAEDVRKVIKHNKEGMDVIAADSALAGITNYINVMNDSSKEDSARKRGLLREVLSCFKDCLLYTSICAEGMIVFGLGGCAMIYLLAPLFDEIFKRIPKRIMTVLCVCLLYTSGTE